MAELTKKEMSRYSRQLRLSEVGKRGQEKLKQGKALIVGAGGLGSPVALYLAAAGVGLIGIADFDKVDESNLQRQIIYSAKDIGNPKLKSAEKAILSLNPNVKVRLHNLKLNSKNAVQIIKDYDLVIDASDNFDTKYVVNDTCVSLNKPDVYGSVSKFEGHASVFNYKKGPCYRCMFPKSPSKNYASEAKDVLGVVPGVIGTIQATEALKILLGIGGILSGRYLVYNALEMKFKELRLGKNKNCSVCSKKE